MSEYIKYRRNIKEYKYSEYLYISNYSYIFIYSYFSHKTKRSKYIK